MAPFCMDLMEMNGAPDEELKKEAGLVQMSYMGFGSENCGRNRRNNGEYNSRESPWPPSGATDGQRNAPTDVPTGGS